MTRRTSAVLLTSGLAVLASLAACSPLYMIRAGYEEARVLWRRQPIEQLLADPHLDDARRAKLQLVLDTRVFAEHTLGLRVGGSYATYARVDDAQVVHVVAAASRLRLESHTWWFPIVGRVPYKGFFSAKQARAEAARLERRGLDTYVRSAVAFSTLGWFDDPLLSTVLGAEPTTLPEIVLHELTHNTLYLPGQAAFNESFATFVGQCGAIAFFAARQDGAGEQQAVEAWREALTFSTFLGEFAVRLRHLYATGGELPARQAVFDEAQAAFRRLGLRDSAFRGFGTEHLNNAVVLHYLTYADRLDLFARVLDHEHGDLRAAIHRVRAAVEPADGDPFSAVARLVASRPDGAGSGPPTPGAAPPR